MYKKNIFMAVFSWFTYLVIRDVEKREKFFEKIKYNYSKYLRGKFYYSQKQDRAYNGIIFLDKSYKEDTYALLDNGSIVLYSEMIQVSSEKPISNWDDAVFLGYGRVYKIGKWFQIKKDRIKHGQFVYEFD